MPEKNVILNDGYCPIHAELSVEQLRNAMAAHPNAKVLSHPECKNEILELSDHIGSTADIIAYAKNSTEKEFIICTEDGVAYRLLSDSPEKRFYFPEPRPCCKDMKLNTLDGIVKALTTGEGEVIISKETRRKALIPLDRMLELAK